MRKKISLSGELHQLRHAVAAVRLLLDRLASDTPESWLMLPGLPMAAVAALSMIDARLTSIDRVVRGITDPAEVWRPWSADGGAPDDETDVVLNGWSTRERIAHLDGELRRARGRREIEQGHRRGRR